VTSTFEAHKPGMKNLDDKPHNGMINAQTLFENLCLHLKKPTQHKMEQSRMGMRNELF
jgi:hypothetical protein